MTRIVMAPMLFALGAWVASIVRDGFADGAMPALLSSRVSPLQFDRITAAPWFWGAAITNGAIAAALLLSAVMILAVGVPQ